MKSKEWCYLSMTFSAKIIPSTKSRMIRLLSILLIGLPLVSMAQSRGFQNPVLLPTASAPAGLATGDWNNDGHADLAYIDSAAVPSLHVLLGNGDRTFHEVQTLPLPAGSCAYPGENLGCYLEQADLNGDGLPDLVFGSTISQSAVVTVLLGQGQGIFAPAIQSSAPLSYSPPSPEGVHMALGDFTGDGHVDVALVDVYDDLLFVMQGDGTGHLSLLHSIQLGTVGIDGFGASNALGSYAEDFNGDGKLDVLIFYQGGGNNSAVVLYGDNDGTFTVGPSYPNIPNVELNLFAVATGGITPSLIGRDGTTAYILPGESTGGFLAPQQIPNALVFSESVVAAADVNGDGIPDLIAQSPAGTSILLGEGNVTFGAPQLVTTGAVTASSIVSADFNGDGVSDLAFAGPGGITFIYGSELNDFAANGIVDSGITVQSLIAGDFVGNGRSQIAVLEAASNSSTTVKTMLTSASGVLSSGPTISMGLTSGSGVVADFDGDGRQDIALGGGYSTGVGPMQVLYGNSDGTFTNVPGTFSGSTPFAGYVNGDNHMDLVFQTGPDANGYYELNALLNNGNRSFTAANTTMPITYFNPELLAVGDLNGDGLADVVLVEDSLPGLHVFLGNGDGTFRIGSGYQTSSQTDAFAGLTTGFIVDMDKDGHNDLVLLAQKKLIIFYGDGTGALNTPQFYPFSRSITSGFQILDIDQDGLPDIAAFGTGLVTTLLNTGHRTFGPESNWVAGQQLNEVVTGDFNGDGFPDLAAADSTIFGGPTSLITTLLNVPVYPGETNNASVATVTVSPTTVAYNQGFTIAVSLAAASSNLPVPTGSVQFSVDGIFLANVNLSNGAASYNVSGQETTSLSPGVHSVAVYYSGDTIFAASVTNSSLTIQPPDYPTQTTLQVQPNSITAGQFVTLTATVTSPITVGNGIVTFYDGPTILGQLAITNGVAVLHTNLFNAGNNSITAAYQGYTTPNGPRDAYSLQPSVSGAVNLSVATQPTVTTLQVSSSTVPAGTVLTLTANVTSTSVPIGAVTFSDGPQALGTSTLDQNGNASLSLVSLGLGDHTLSATFVATDPFAASSSLVVPVTVNASVLPASVGYVSAASGAKGELQLTARVLAVNEGVAVGTATLLGDGRIAGVGAVSAGAPVVFHVTASQAGIHTFYVSFSGSAGLAPVASPAFFSTSYDSSPDFTLAVQQPRDGRVADLAGTVQLTAVGSLGWSGTEHFACVNGVPAGYACSFSRAASQGSGTTTLSFVTTKASAGNLRWMYLAALAVPFCFRRRRLPRLLVLCSVLAVGGCGSGASNERPKPLSVVTVQATSEAVVHSVQLVVR